MATEHLSSDDIAPLARRIADDIVWCTMTTVGPHPHCRPRGRIVHPIWRWTEEPAGPIGFVTSRPTALRSRHLAVHPVASMAYWSPAHDALFVDVDVSAVDGPRRREVWELAASRPPPVGFDPATIFPAGPDDDGFAPLHLTVRRIQVVLADRMARGEPSFLWSSLGSARGRDVGAAISAGG